MNSQHQHHRTLNLKGFTAFADVRFEFSDTVNVLVGENGTGKSHVLKALYAAHTWLRRDAITIPDPLIAAIFRCDTLNDIVRHGDDTAICSGNFGTSHAPWLISVARAGRRNTARHPSPPSGIGRPVFIPSIDMMAHTRRFLSTYEEYNIHFDQTHRDIVALLLAPERRASTDGESAAEALTEILGGALTEEGERFYLDTPHGKQPMPLVAEGLRKVATLYQLMRNGMLDPGSVLLWDEPEISLNPKLMDDIVDALLHLSRSGVQIFLATHSYVILKELDLQAKRTDGVRYFGFGRTDHGTVVHATDDYAQLDPNPIAEQFDSIYDRELGKALGRERRLD